MRRNYLILGLVLSNAALLVALIWQAQHPRAGRSEPTPMPHSSEALPETSSSSSAPEVLSTNAPSETARSASAAALLNGLITNPTNLPHFDWHQVESADYRTYVKNLRAIGCPEETVKDIVTADLLQAFAARRAKIMAERYQDFQFWKSDSIESSVRSQLETRRREVDEEMTAALESLLGASVTPPATKAEWERAALRQQLSFLPEDKRAQAETLLLQSAEADEQHRNFSDGRVRLENPDERARVLKTYDQSRSALQELLTPDEFTQLELSVSWTADNLRRAMTKFQPTEAEFRLIFQEWRTHDDNLAHLRGTGQADPGNDHVFARIKELLPPERYDLYRATWWK